MSLYLAPEVKTQIFGKYAPNGNAQDVGSPESQIALFTYRINYLNEHLKRNKKDTSAKLGLLRLVGKRRKLLNYLMKEDVLRYRAIIKELGVRR